MLSSMVRGSQTKNGRRKKLLNELYFTVMFHVKQVLNLLFSRYCAFSFLISIGYGSLIKWPCCLI